MWSTRLRTPRRAKNPSDECAQTHAGNAALPTEGKLKRASGPFRSGQCPINLSGLPDGDRRDGTESWGNAIGIFNELLVRVLGSAVGFCTLLQLEMYLRRPFFDPQLSDSPLAVFSRKLSDETRAYRRKATIAVLGSVLQRWRWRTEDQQLEDHS
jgi:hypothetical protein